MVSRRSSDDVSVESSLDALPRALALEEPGTAKLPALTEVGPGENLEGPRWWRPGLAALATFAAIVALVCSTAVFPYLTSNSDEGAYLAQAEALASGHVLPPAPDKHPTSYLPWFSTYRHGVFVYKYTPVHASFLAASILTTGSPLPALPVLAAADVVLFALLVRAVGASHRAALGAGVLLALSPSWFIQAGTYLPYLSTLALLLGFALGVVVGTQRHRARYLLLAGACIGFAFFSRQYDAVLFASSVLLVTGWWHWRTERSWLLRGLGWVMVGAVPAVVLFLAYNWLATGSPFKLTFNLLESSDSLGFGRHRVLPTDPILDYTPKLALRAMIRWLLLVIGSTAGGLPLLALTVAAVARDPKLPGRRLWMTLAVVWPVGYLFFWGLYSTAFLWDGAIFLGPYYHLPMIVALVAAAAVMLDRLAKDRRRLAQILLGLTATFVVVTGFLQVRTNVDRTDRRRTVAEAVDTAVGRDRHALVLLAPLRSAVLQHPFSWLRNRPDYTGSRVFAVHNPANDADVVADHPDRHPYLVSLVGGFADARGPQPRPVVSPQQVGQGSQVGISLSTGRVPSGSTRTLRIGFGGRTGGRLPLTAPADVGLHVFAFADRILCTNATGNVLAVSGARTTATTLLVAVDDVDHRGHLRSSELAVPVRSRRGRIDVMVPGETIRADGASRPLLSMTQDHVVPRLDQAMAIIAVSG